MSRQPETGPSLRRFLEQQKRQAGRAQNSSPFTRSGSGVTAVDEVTYEGVLKILGQMVVDGTLTVNGPLAVTQTADITGTTHIGGATDIDGTLNVDADATFGGAMAITGTLSLPAGIIDNDALANPVVQASTWADVKNFAVPNTWTEQVSCSLTVPAGFTLMLFSATGSVTVLNSQASTQYLMARVMRQTNGAGTINSGAPAQTTLPATWWSSVITPYSISVSVVPGDTLRFWVEARTGVGFAADVDHVARIEVAATFTRG